MVVLEDLSMDIIVAIIIIVFIIIVLIIIIIIIIVIIIIIIEIFYSCRIGSKTPVAFIKPQYDIYKKHIE